MSSLPPTNVDPEWGLEGWKTASLLKKKPCSSILRVHVSCETDHRNTNNSDIAIPLKQVDSKITI
jgi:hypothetical protein